MQFSKQPISLVGEEVRLSLIRSQDDFDMFTKISLGGRRSQNHIPFFSRFPNFVLVSSSTVGFATMADEFEFPDKGNKIIYETEAKGFNPGLLVLLVVGGLVLLFLVGNYVLYSYAQKTLPPRKKKPVSKKKMKRERLKQGVSAPGE
ncbi:hypothetical protein V6N11_021044 [Hibiscus sabdariffa]|uniref:DNA-binding protein S1FA n=2 Tax=Hibiscus sabdariffa TaxID=183260 RepID=A0ABR2AA10_9ROSI